MYVALPCRLWGVQRASSHLRRLVEVIRGPVQEGGTARIFKRLAWQGGCKGACNGELGTKRRGPERTGHDSTRAALKQQPTGSGTGCSPDVQATRQAAAASSSEARGAISCTSQGILKGGEQNWGTSCWLSACRGEGT